MIILHNIEKQPPRGVPEKRCSENMQQIYKRTSMQKCDFYKVPLFTLLKSHFGMGVLLWICCIFSEHLVLRTPLDGCFWIYNFCYWIVYHNHLLFIINIFTERNFLCYSKLLSLHAFIFNYLIFIGVCINKVWLTIINFNVRLTETSIFWLALWQI